MRMRVIKKIEGGLIKIIDGTRTVLTEDEVPVASPPVPTRNCP